MAASYPSAVKTYTTKNDGPGNTILAAHVNELQDEITALEQALLTNGLAHDLKFIDATYDIGKAGATRPRHYFGSGNMTIGGALAVTGLATFTGDLYSVDWTDYSATSSITGWSSFTTKQIWYKKIGKLVFVRFYLAGTSNATGASFTLPYASADAFGGTGLVALGSCTDNGVFVSQTKACALDLPPSSSTPRILVNDGTTGFTASGTKIIQGQFFFQATA